MCPHCNVEFPRLAGQPVLMRHDNEVFSLNDYRVAKVESTSNFKLITSRYLPGKSVNLSRTDCFQRIANSIERGQQTYILVVGGGRQRHALQKFFCNYPEIQFVYCDVDVAATVEIFCDAHDLPFIDGCFDGVITTAVLEHVLAPARVASEITRVLKIGGFLYSELPFMQQVHEGAYDFSRYSLSGHRKLFNYFQEIDSGMVAGPATALVWAIESFILSFFRRQYSRVIAKMLLRPLIFWFKYFDYLLKHRSEAVDGASCTYFFGRRQQSAITDRSIVDHYDGARQLRHL